MSVCRPHPDEIAHCAVLCGHCLRMKLYPDTDTNDKNSPTLFNSFNFYPNTDVRILIQRGGIATLIAELVLGKSSLRYEYVHNEFHLLYLPLAKTFLIGSKTNIVRLKPI